MVSLFLLVASLGSPRRSILLSFFPGYAGDMLGCSRSFLNTFLSLSFSSQIRWARCERTLYALEIRLDARDYLLGLLTFAISRVTENIDHKRREIACPFTQFYIFPEVFGTAFSFYIYYIYISQLNLFTA